MRSIIGIFAVIAAFGVHTALAENRTGQGALNIAPPFAEDGIYVPAGKMVEVAIAGQCHRFTNHDRQIGLFFRPSDPAQWPGGRDETRAPMEPKVTEEPCK